MAEQTSKRARRARSASAVPATGETVVTLEMVAAAAGVSPSTVSRILNGTAKVHADKKAAVDAAIARLGFRPNPVARGLAGGRTLSIGVVTQAINSPFYGEGLRGIEDELAAAGYMPLFVSGHWNAADEQRCIDLLLSRRVDGVIMFTGRLSDEALLALAAQVPTVVTGRKLAAPRLVDLNFDNVEGARLATQHLIGLGHRRIVHITGDMAHADAVDREQGYRQALQQAGLAVDPALIVPGNFLEASGLAALDHLFDTRQDFSAIFAANDQMAAGVSLGLYRRHLRVPDDVSLVGFDDLAASTYSVPPLTTVRQPVFELGRLSAAAMLGLLRGETPQVALPPPRLVLRESTRPLRP
ncbi:MAG: substrate-binding domain-containing protein [Burkholderiaceae bacterium]